MQRDDLAPYLAAGRFVDADDPGVVAFARAAAGAERDELARAVRLYYAVRDQVLYDPYHVGEDPEYYRAGACLAAGRGFCIPKAALLAACARAVGLPARVGYADVRNHLSTPRLEALIGGSVYTWHSYTEFYLEGRWVKATPAFDGALCARLGVHALEFDGREDSLFQEYNRAGHRHMEYVRERGT
ncbi:MAG TPA: transglutaminase-like domain-containing protein, partial [Gammaproteobacteria bacterium]